MIRLCGVSEEAIVMKFSHGHMLVLKFSGCTLILNSGIEDVGIPTKLASGKEEDRERREVEKMSIRDALQRLAMVVIQDDVLRTSDLFTITWQNDSYLSDRSIRGLIAMPLTSRIKTKGNVTLLCKRHGMGQLKSLLILANPRMVVIKHVLEVLQCALVTWVFQALLRWKLRAS